MDERFYTEANISKEELQAHKDYIANYLDKRSKKHRIVEACITSGIIERENNYEQMYREVDDLIKGKVLGDQTSEVFATYAGNNEALAIMNSKAAIFDVRSLNVELRAKSQVMWENTLASGEHTIEVINRILNESYLSQSKYSFIFSDAIKYSRGYPMAITLIGWDNNATLGRDTNVKGDITCENIPLESFWWDPAANELDNCEFVFISKVLPLFRVDDFIKTLSEKDRDLLLAYYIQQNAIETREGGNSELASNNILVRNGAIELISFYQRIKEDGEWKIKIYHVVGGNLVVGEQTLDIPYLPFAILKEQNAPDSFTGISSVMLAMPLIKRKYFLDQTFSNIAMIQKNPNYVISGASGIDGSQLIDWSTSDTGKVFVTNGDVNNSISLVASPILDPNSIQWRNILDQEIQRAIGMSDVATGGLQSKLSGAATDAAIQQATIQENTTVSELERYLVRFVRIMLEFFRLKFPKMRTKEALAFRALPNQDADPDMYDIIYLDKKDFKNLEADIMIDASLLRTSRKQKQLNDMMTLLSWEMQYNDGQAFFITIEDIVKELNVPNKQQVLRRLRDKMDGREQQMAVALVQNVLQLMQDPEAQGMDVQTATLAVLDQIKQAQRGGQ